ncbi:MarR family transcriptional regulator [Campylobacter sp. VicNov18]|uniref:MarR family transcriptional regulator n=1 Tax=Campylobacter bilis TaxID=2691918 RepID=UPI00187B7BEC|nr:helix-turn-helix domain-containing protein [Campylobacter bilis]MBM0636873.1 hypothetical protein [Campylobacter bilis]MCC8277582.1 MarR family transcriptional regulator [Campylobacter bilis]MCC8299191.1 MarR family transcriptional regulator [Campylobacter bilis]MCC8300491.1 MarR family transcriptional regulator [Campylobacter bilis]MCC8349517.1 MarR family transcriptional regulator [Campylobacter bilis]
MEKLIWIELSVNINEDGYCKASLNDFAKVFYVSKNIISRAINKLKKLDLIDIEENSGRKRKFLIKGFNKHNLASEGFNTSKSHDQDLKSLTKNCGKNGSCIISVRLKKTTQK